MPKKEITLKCCPLCGSMPTHQVDDMGTGAYQHYYGSFNYIYKCPKCGIIHASADTVYCKDSAEADKKAREAWNKECDKWEKVLSWRTKVDSIEEGMEPKYDLDALADYVTKTPIEQLNKEVAKLNEHKKEQLINMLLCSKYNIFNPWYKRLLISLDTYRSKDILDYYKDGFDKVKEK